MTPQRLSGLLRLLESGEISTASAKEVLEAMLDSPGNAADLVRAKGLGAIRDSGALESAVTEILAGNPSQVALYRSGKTQTFGWFVGQVMKNTAATGTRSPTCRARSGAASSCS